MQPADAVLRFIESIGRHAEAEFWLTLFRSQAKERFATLVIESPVMEHAFDAVVLDLRFLAALELVPVVCLGLHDDEQADDDALRLQQGLKQAGVQSIVLEATQPEAIVQAVNAGQIPILPFARIAQDAPTKFLELGDLLTTLQVRKLIFLSRRGAITHNDMPVANINLTTEFDMFAHSDELSARQRTIVEQSRRLVMERVPHKLLVSVTSPLELLRELFTVKGAGTMLRRGAVITVRSGFANVDRRRLHDLLNDSFGRPPRDDFFDRPVSRIFLEENYRGAAIVVDTPLGGYLTKFAVDRQAQGEGLGRDLWLQLASDYNTFYWRARAKNPINAWYIKEADGFVRMPDWQIFWRGLSTDDIPRAIHYALSQPDDMGSG